jgi:predicted XRE-type DNA-binding protein
MTSILDLAKKACEAYDPLADFERLSSEERSRWVAVADAVRYERKPINKSLTWAQVCRIRELHEQGQGTQRQIAALFGVSQNTVGEILRKEIRREK